MSTADLPVVFAIVAVIGAIGAAASVLVAQIRLALKHTRYYNAIAPRFSWWKNGRQSGIRYMQGDEYAACARKDGWLRACSYLLHFSLLLMVIGFGAMFFAN